MVFEDVLLLLHLLPYNDWLLEDFISLDVLVLFGFFSINKPLFVEGCTGVDVLFLCVMMEDESASEDLTIVGVLSSLGFLADCMCLIGELNPVEAFDEFGFFPFGESVIETLISLDVLAMLGFLSADGPLRDDLICVNTFDWLGFLLGESCSEECISMDALDGL